MEKNSIKIIKWVFGLSVFMFIAPSIIYFFRTGGNAFVPNTLEFKFLLDGNIDNRIHVITYLMTISIMILLYFIVLKKRDKLFKSMKAVYKYIIVISLICVVSLPFMSSDIYYYLGIGRLCSKYGQNPYYTDMKSYIDENNTDMSNDSVMETGYKNYWASTTVVYGALWSCICTIVAFFSFGSLNAGILIFKLLNALIHILNCILLYKISKKKIFPLLYGLNPFVLVEGIVNVHNDIFMVFFILLAIYEIFKKKRIYTGLLALALATSIKYVAVLLLPILIIYYVKNESIKVRLIKCIKYGLIFAIFVMIPYIFYIRDFSVFNGLLTQQQRFAKGLYCYLVIKFPDSMPLVGGIRIISIYTFIVLYIIICIKLIINKNIKFYKEMRKDYIIFLFFLMFMLTNFQPWYFVWLSVFLIWQKSQNIRLITQIQLITLFANSVFVLYSEMYLYTEYYFEIFVIATIACYTLNKTLKNFQDCRLSK